MPTPVPPGLRLGLTEPADAIAAFQARGLLQPTFRWQDVFNEEHSRAFAVAGVARLDVLKAVQDELELTLTEGRSLADFSKRIRPVLSEKGYWGPVEVADPATGATRITEFNDSRLRTVFDVNMRQSQAAGRWHRIERTKATLPLVMYRTMHDERVRASHRAWDGVTLPVDDPWWSTHYPPNGWRCRCRAFALDAADLERRRAAGQVVKTEAPPDELVTYVNPATGEVIPVPRGVDPGFGYNPGKARDADLYEQLLRKAVKASPVAGAVAVAQATIDHGAMVAQATAKFGAWVHDVLFAAKPRGEIQFVGSVKAQAVRAMQEAGRPLASAAIIARDQQVLQAIGQPRGAVLVPVAVYKRLPELLTRATAILEDKDAGELLYLIDLLQADGSIVKLSVVIDTSTTLRRGTAPMNLVRGVSVADPQALQDTTRFELLWGAL